MRQKRAKAYKRLMALYVQTFNFRAPFQVLVSNDLLSTTEAQQLDIKKLLATCVQGEIKPMMTQCCMEALYAGGKDIQKVTNLAKTFERRRCNHRTAIAPDECLTDVIGETNKHRYILATQSTPLLTSLSRIPGLPIVHFNPRGVLVLSPPSTATVRAKNTVEEGRRLEGQAELAGLDEGDNVVGGGFGAGSAARVDLDAPPPGLGLGRRKVKQPNPLSVKKRKVEVDKKPKVAGADKRKRPTEGEGDEDERGGGAETDVDVEVTGAAGTTGTGGDGRKSKKKRKRKNRSEVAKVIGELNATNQAGGIAGDESD